MATFYSIYLPAKLSRVKRVSFFAKLYEMNLPIYDVIIIGAGASGLMCARECARRGQKTLLLEKDALPARKILVSGNGRCNLTNANVSPEYYHADPVLITSALKQFSFRQALDYFHQLGVLTQEEALGRVFPQTGKSTAVAEALKLAVKEAGAELLTGQEVLRVKRGKTFLISTKQGQNFQSKKLVLACGSCAYPQVTGTNLGYELAKKLGHTIIQPRPALSALCVKETAVARLTGIRSQVELSAWQDKRLLARAEGEILFTNYGVNGPAVLNISSAVSRALAHGNVPLTINFFAQIKEPKKFLEERLKQFSHRKPKDFFAGILHESIANLLIDFIGLRKNIPMQEQTPNGLQRIGETLTAWPLTATGVRPWTEAMAATGGVNTKEINYNTFESLKCPGLFITGELLDVDGKSGGFNLHFAWASGYIAAKNVSEEK